MRESLLVVADWHLNYDGRAGGEIGGHATVIDDLARHEMPAVACVSFGNAGEAGIGKTTAHQLACLLGAVSAATIARS
jgi:hypothetical protein